MKPVDIEVFIAYLKFLGLECIRVESSHWIFDYPDGQTKLDRPIIIRVHKDKQIPILHIHTNLLTIGKSHKQFEAWLKLPKKKRKNSKKE